MTPFDSRTRDKAAEVAEEQLRLHQEASRECEEISELVFHCEVAHALKDIAAAIRALPAASPGGWMVPEGYKLVPIEPTEAMCRAGESGDGTSKSERWIDGGYTPENVERIYRVMLEAAPPPPSQDGDAG